MQLADREHALLHGNKPRLPTDPASTFGTPRISSDIHGKAPDMIPKQLRLVSISNGEDEGQAVEVEKLNFTFRSSFVSPTN